MTKVIYNPAEFRMEITGHSGYAIAGQDIVCSAISMLVMTLETMVSDHAESLQPRIHRKDGERKIICSPTKGNATKCMVVFDTIYSGFELLALNCPEYVKAVKVKEE